MRFFERHSWVFSIMAMLAIIGSAICGGLGVSMNVTAGSFAGGAFAMYLAAGIVLFWSAIKSWSSDLDSLNLASEALEELRAAERMSKLLKDLRGALSVKENSGILPLVKELLKSSRDAKDRISRAEAQAKKQAENELQAAKSLAESRAQRNTALERKVRELESTLETKSSELKALKASQSALSGEAEQHKFFRELSTRLSEEKAALEELQTLTSAELRNTESLLEETRAQQQTLEQELNEVKSSSAERDRKYGRALANNATLEAEVSRLSGDLATARKQIEGLEERRNTLAHELERRTAELARKTNEFVTLTARLSAADEQVRSLAQHNSQLEIRVANFVQAQLHRPTAGKRVPDLGMLKRADASEGAFQAVLEERDRLMRIFEQLAEKFPEDVEAALQATE